MELFRDELLTVQEEYLREDTLTIDPEENEDLDSSNDDLGENTEITPIGDDIEDDELKDSFSAVPGEDEDDLLNDDEDVLLDDEEELLDDEEEIVDYQKITAISEEDDLADEDDEDLFDDEDDDLDDIENPDVIPVVPDLDEDDEVWTDDEDDDALLDDDEDLADDDTGSTTAGMTGGFSTPSRSSSNIVDHEPGTASNRDL